MSPITWPTCFFFMYICLYIRSVLRRQSRDTNRNIKLTCCILSLRIVNSNVSSVGPLSERKGKRNVREKTLKSQNLQSVMAVHPSCQYGQYIYIQICRYTIPTTAYLKHVLKLKACERTVLTVFKSILSNTFHRVECCRPEDVKIMIFPSSARREPSRCW